MPTTDPLKNLDYVKKSQMKKKETLGADAYNKINADNEQKHRDKLKATMGIDEYKKQQAEYMKLYRQKKKSMNTNNENKQKSMNTISDAMKVRRAQKELQTLAIEKANKTANKLSEIVENAKELIKKGKTITEKSQIPKKKRGRKPKAK
jgi:hypothetical protein